MEEPRELGVVTGGCTCGAVRFEAAFPSRFCAHCHCRNCRRAHGAAFVTYAGFPRESVRMLAGEPVRHLTGTGATRGFCGTCGSTMFYESPRWEGEVHVVVGCLDGELDRPPSAHVYVDHKASWWPITDDLPRYGGETGVEPKAP